MKYYKPFIVWDILMLKSYLLFMWSSNLIGHQHFTGQPYIPSSVFLHRKTLDPWCVSQFRITLTLTVGVSWRTPMTVLGNIHSGKPHPDAEKCGLAISSPGHRNNIFSTFPRLRSCSRICQHGVMSGASRLPQPCQSRQLQGTWVSPQGRYSSSISPDAKTCLSSGNCSQSWARLHHTSPQKKL